MGKIDKPFNSAPASLLLVSLLAFGIGFTGMAENGVAINNDGADPNANAALDVKSPSTGAGKGILIPRVTAAQRTTASASLDGGLLDGSGNLRGGAAQGLMVYQTDGSEGFYYNTSKTSTPTWVYLGASAGTVTSVTAATPLTGGEITTSGTIGIDKASATVDGYLSKADWTTFNGKGSSNLALGETSSTAYAGDKGAAAYAAAASATSASTASTIVKRDASGNFSAGTITANLAAAGGTINGTTIGVTTPAAGSFTTLASSGATNISGGAVTLGAAGSGSVGKIVLHDAQSSTDFTTTLQSADNVAASMTFKWPAADGASGQVLTTNGSGILSFQAGGGGRGAVRCQSPARPSPSATVPPLTTTAWPSASRPPPPPPGSPSATWPMPTPTEAQSDTRRTATTRMWLWDTGPMAMPGRET